MARWDERDSKRFALWVLVVMAPLMTLLMVLDPGPWRWWHYVGIVLYPVVAVRSAYQLFMERKVTA